VGRPPPAALAGLAQARASGADGSAGCGRAASMGCSCGMAPAPARGAARRVDPGWAASLGGSGVMAPAPGAAGRAGQWRDPAKGCPGGMALTDTQLELAWRPFAFRLPQEMVTAQGTLVEKRGWLLKLTAADGRPGWGEAAPLEPQAPGAGAPQPAGSQGPGFESQGPLGQRSLAQSSQSPDPQGPKGQPQVSVAADGQPEAPFGASATPAPGVAFGPNALLLSGPGEPNAVLASSQGHAACAAGIAAAAGPAGVWAP